MGNTLTIRLPKDLSDWLDNASREAGVPRGRLIRMELERVRRTGVQKPFMKHLGSLDLEPDASMRKGLVGQAYPGTARRAKK